jgi:hypothetical protein
VIDVQRKKKKKLCSHREKLGDSPLFLRYIFTWITLLIAELIHASLKNLKIVFAASKNAIFARLHLLLGRDSIASQISWVTLFKILA